jgi:hypothetical protein
VIHILELREHLRVEHTEDDPYIEALEAGAVRAIEQWTDRHFGPVVEFEDIFSGGGPHHLTYYLREAPTDAPSPPSVVVDLRTNTVYEEVDSDDYELEGRALHNLSGGWQRGFRNYRVTYDAGYAAGQEPADIRHAVKLLVAHWYERRLPVPETVVSQQQLPLSIREVLAPYRRSPVR